MISLNVVLATWIMFLPNISGVSATTSRVAYQETPRKLLLEDDWNTFVIGDHRNLLSCARSCKSNELCTAFGFRDNNELGENCLLMKPGTQQTLPASYDGYHYYLMTEDSKTTCDATVKLNLDSWLVFQRRSNGEVDFYRNWTKYKNGFGDPCGEFWLGNDKLHELTKDGDKELRIELVDNEGVMAVMQYGTFLVGDEQSNYKLTISDFNGATPPAGDSMAYHNGSEFSTYDVDNDVNGGSCATSYKGGWWYATCHHANLNGLYGATIYAQGINWLSWKGHHYSLSATRMMIRRK